MIELLELGISEKTIKEMFERVPELNDIDSKDLKEKIYFLERLNCSNFEIVNIISSNPNYLIRTNKEIGDILEKIVSLGFKRLDYVLDANPYILNLDQFEIDKYINNRIKNGESREDIIIDLEENPYLFSEV